MFGVLVIAAMMLTTSAPGVAAEVPIEGNEVRLFGYCGGNDVICSFSHPLDPIVSILNDAPDEPPGAPEDPETPPMPPPPPTDIKNRCWSTGYVSDTACLWAGAWVNHWSPSWYYAQGSEETSCEQYGYPNQPGAACQRGGGQVYGGNTLVSSVVSLSGSFDGKSFSSQCTTQPMPDMDNCYTRAMSTWTQGSDGCSSVRASMIAVNAPPDRTAFACVQS